MSLVPALCPGLVPTLSALADPAQALIAFGPVLWLRADQGVTGNPVSAWADWSYPGRSAPLRNYAQATAGKQPSVGGTPPRLSFDGTDWLGAAASWTQSKPWSVCLTVTLASTTYNEGGIWYASSPAQSVNLAVDLGAGSEVTVYDGDTYDFGATAAGKQTIVFSQDSSNDVRCYRDGVLLNLSTASGFAACLDYLGEGWADYQQLIGDLYEVLVIPSADAGVVVAYQTWAESQWGAP